MLGSEAVAASLFNVQPLNCNVEFVFGISGVPSVALFVPSVFE